MADESSHAVSDPATPAPAAAAMPAVTVPAAGTHAVAVQPSDAAEVPLRLGFFQQRWVQEVLPLVTSIVTHVVIVLLGLVVFAVAQQVVPREETQEQVIIPTGSLAESGPPGGIPNVGPNDNPFQQALQDQIADSGSAEGFANKPSPNVDPSAAGGGEQADLDLSRLGAGSFGSLGQATGAGSGQGGPLAQFGTPGGGAIGPRGPVFGNGGNARQIMFVCDATGTMINKIGALKAELTREIEKLRPVQSFNVVFYYDSGKYTIADRNTLLMANGDNKRKTYEFLTRVTPEGPTDPIPALEAAFRQRPQLLYFLSDGEFDNLKSYDEVIDAIRRFNPDKKTKVNTIMFVSGRKDDDEGLRKAEEAMKKIASENGGNYNPVTEDKFQY